MCLKYTNQKLLKNSLPKALLLIFICSLNIFSQSQNKNSWEGNYRYESMAGKRDPVTGFKPSIHYTISTSKSDTQLSGTFEANGFQTFETYICDVKENGNQIEFYYQSGGVGDDKMNSRLFKKNQLLFSLEKIQGRGKTLYRFLPAAYSLVTYSKQRKIIYFDKD